MFVGLGLAGVLCTGCVNAHKRFGIHEVSAGIYEGFKPTSKEHFEALHARGIRTILSVESLHFDILPERHLAKKYGFTYIDVPILASPLEPRERRVREALVKMDDPSLRPIYLHCLQGRDRTAFLIGLYRIYFEGWSPEDAWEEMLRGGFKVRWSLRGFTTYFWKHCQRPEWVRSLKAK